VKIGPGSFRLPKRASVEIPASLPREAADGIFKRLRSIAHDLGVDLARVRARSRSAELNSAVSQNGILRCAPTLQCRLQAEAVRFLGGLSTRETPPAALRQAYRLHIDRGGITVDFTSASGLHAAVATLRQLFREHGRDLPCLTIVDWPDFPRRGVMLDISRGRVPKVETLIALADHLADFKINELQLYTEHTFAYRKYRPVWRDWGALTAADIRRLDRHCRALGVDLVPNQNSFGHLRYFLEHPRLKKLAEVAAPYEDAGGAFVRRPSTVAPVHPGTLPFLRGLYDELLPNFSSRYFNVGCDETWDLGRGQSKAVCAARGKGRVYVDFLKAIRREVTMRGRSMMFWGDIILKYPGLIRDLGVPPSGRPEAKRTVEDKIAPLIALNWGYEANHPFPREAAAFARANIPFYICPGTSTWMTLIGRHDNALENLRHAAVAGKRFGAIGFLITDWGDGGHPQPLAVSWLPYLAGAALAWNASGFDERVLERALSRDVFGDRSGVLAKAARDLGYAHRKLGYCEPNLTPLGAVIAAPPPEERELFCRDGLKYYARIPGPKVRATLAGIEAARATIPSALKRNNLFARELDLAARMAAESCRFMLWQQAVAAGKISLARRMAAQGIRDLRQLQSEFAGYWPARNKATPKKCAAFLEWRIADYSRVGSRVCQNADA
jgi:hexosaminidase